MGEYLTVVTCDFPGLNTTLLAPSKLEQHLETDLINYNIYLETILILFGMTTLGSMQKDVILPFFALSVAKEPKFELLSYESSAFGD